MCRFTAYHGPPIPLDEMLYKPEHSLIHQSVHSHEREEPLNGDGWGVGWYQPDIEPHPALYRTVRPAWSDDNMRQVSPLVRTPLYFAHVRAASPGLAVQRLNCHPFMGGQRQHAENGGGVDDLERGRRRLLFMHNGRIGAYRRVMRQLRRELSDALYFTVRGTTDSEHAFAVVQQKLGEKVVDPSPDDLAKAMGAGIQYLEDLKRSVGGDDETTRANFCLSDGRAIVATRYASPIDDQALSLYVGRAREFYTDEADEISARGPEETGAVLVSSERLFADDRVWEPVPRDHAVIVEEDRSVRFEPLDVD